MRMVVIMLVQVLAGVEHVWAQANPSGSAFDDVAYLNVSQNSTLGPALATIGSSGAYSFSMGPFMGAMIFGAVGLVAFVYGKKNRSWKPMVIGIALMGFPYVITSTLWTYVVGTVLCLLLYFWRDA
jgi:hypothetical protein